MTEFLGHLHVMHANYFKAVKFVFWYRKLQMTHVFVGMYDLHKSIKKFKIDCLQRCLELRFSIILFLIQAGMKFADVEVNAWQIKVAIQ